MKQGEGVNGHSPTGGYWSMHFSGGPVQDRNEERMASEKSVLCVHKIGFTSSDIKKLTVFAVLMCVCVCVCAPGKGCGRLEESSSVNPVLGGF